MRSNAKGHEKVHVFLDVLHGGFGLLLVEQFGNVKLAKEFGDAIKKALNDFTFPVVNFVFSAAGKLRHQDNNDLKVETRLDELQLGVTVTGLDNDGNELPEGGQEEKPVKTLGLFPWQTLTAKPQGSTAKFAPSLSATLGPLTAGLSVAVSALLRPRPEVLLKPFMGNYNKFGWYMKSDDEKSCEGVHYAAAVLQVHRDVEQLDIRAKLQTDWIGGNVDNQTITFEPDRRFEVCHPDEPKTPMLVDVTDPTTLPILLTRDMVSGLFGEDLTDTLIDGGELKTMETSVKRSDGNGMEPLILITRASLLTCLGEYKG